MLERVRITVRSGGLHLTGESRDDVDVEGASLSGAPPEIEVKGGSKRASVRVPSTAEILVGAGSGDVTIRGTVGPVRVTTQSAAVKADDVAAIDARTSSGRLRVGRCRGDLRLRSPSATVKVDRVDGDVRVSTVSATVEVAETHGAVAVTAVSGSIEVTVDGNGPVRLETVSGSITVRVAGSRRPDVKMRTGSGKSRVEVETGHDFTLEARTVSGRIKVVPA